MVMVSQTITIETEPDMSIMRKLVAASSAVTALAVGGAIALAVSGLTTPAVADSGATITASATNLTPATPSTGASTITPSATSSAAPADPVAAPAASALTEEQAIAIAIAQVPGASVGRVEMEPEHGLLVWKIDLVADSADYEFRIDASSGAVVRAEVDGDDSDSADDRDDDGDDDGDDHGHDGSGSDDD